MIFGSHAQHECVIETTDANTVGLWSTRSLVISTLVNSHLFIGQFDPWSIRTSIVPKSTRSSVFLHLFRVLIKRIKSKWGWTLITVKNLFWVRSLTLRTVLIGLDAGFRKGRFVLNNSKQKHKKFLNFHQNSLENEIIFAKMGVAPSESNVTLRLIFSRLLTKLAWSV